MSEGFPEYDKLKKAATVDGDAKKRLLALEQTLDFYKIKQRRALMAEAILQFADWKETTIPSDQETSALKKMVEHFKGLHD
jgi:hypothetical protein